MSANGSLVAPGGAFVVQRQDDADGGRVVVELGPRLDAEGAEALRRVAVELGDDGCRHLHLDLSMLEVLDWTALALLASLDPHFRRLGGEATCSGATPGVSQVLRFTRLDRRLEDPRPEEEPC